MKYIAILLLLISCSNSPIKESKDSASYVNKYNNLRRELLTKASQCREYTNTTLISSLDEKHLEKNKFVFQFKNNKAKIRSIKSYNPSKFDWGEVAKIKELYLNYPYDENISELHFNNTNDLQNCANDFDNLNFLTTIINAWESDKKNSKLYRSAIEKYFAYMKSNETPLIAVLTLDHLVQLMHEKELLKLKDPDTYLKASNEMSDVYTKAGRKVLLSFKDKNFKLVYDLDKELQEKQRNFKRLIFEQTSL